MKYQSQQPVPPNNSTLPSYNQPPSPSQWNFGARSPPREKDLAKYTRPYFQEMFKKRCRFREFFDDPEYVDKANSTR